MTWQAPEEIVRMPARWLTGPLPSDLPIYTEGLQPVTDPNDLPLDLSDSDTGKAWRIWHSDSGCPLTPFWYVWQQDHYGIYRADLECTS